MEPMNPLRQLSMCCGLGRPRDYRQPANYFYSPSSAQLDTGTSWTSPYIPSQPQTCLLFTQPVIFAGNPVPNQANTVTLVQNAQSNTSQFPLSILTSTQTGLTNTGSLMPRIISSQYSIHNSSATFGANLLNNVAQPGATYQIQHGSNMLVEGPRNFVSPTRNATTDFVDRTKRPITLNSDIFRQIEAIEKQSDLSKEMEFIGRFGVVIVRAIDPYALMLHMTDATLRNYNERFLVDNSHVIRFIEIIKRPGQTLGLYIRTVHFEALNSRYREGLIITKIDTDSPVYNSQVLHVGDEILSINLVDIQGMSLDDIVIIMSMPRRLVLALKIPRDRDGLLKKNLLEQQRQRMATSADEMMITKADETSIAQFGLGQRIANQAGNSHDISMTSNSRALEEAGRLRRSIPNPIGTDPNLGLYNPVPVRARSATFINEIIDEDILNPLELQNQSSRESDHMNRRYTSLGHREFSAEIDYELAKISNVMFNDDYRTTSLTRPERLPARHDNNRFSTSYEMEPYTDITPDGKLDSIPGNIQKEHSVLSCSDNFRPSSNSNSVVRRTLPNKPDSVTSPVESTKQPILSNIRLADTPEQSSYFSSSIEAINRELKELRRQRMALGNSENYPESSPMKNLIS